MAEHLRTAVEVWNVPLVKGEISEGARWRPNDGLLTGLLAKPTLGVLLPIRESAEHYARRFVQLRRAGTPVPDDDPWIAALALELDLTLIAQDRHFARIPQLSCG